MPHWATGQEESYNTPVLTSLWFFPSAPAVPGEQTCCSWCTAMSGAHSSAMWPLIRSLGFVTPEHKQALTGQTEEVPGKGTPLTHKLVYSTEATKDRRARAGSAEPGGCREKSRPLFPSGRRRKCCPRLPFQVREIQLEKPEQGPHEHEALRISFQESPMYKPWFSTKIVYYGLSLLAFVSKNVS